MWEGSEISVKVNVNEYIQKPVATPIRAENLVRIALLAQTIRNQLLHPLQVAAHEALGVLAPCHLGGLPNEPLIMIAEELDTRSLLNMGQTCKRLNSVIEEKKLWRKFYRRHFPSQYKYISTTPNTDWKGEFVFLYSRFQYPYL